MVCLFSNNTKFLVKPLMAFDDLLLWISDFLPSALGHSRLQEQFPLGSVKVVTPALHFSTHHHHPAWPQPILYLHVLLQAFMPQLKA